MFIRKDKIIQNLKVQFTQLKNKMELVSNSYVDDLFSKLKINESQSVLIKEIINCSKVKSIKGRRYSEDWMLLCMLLYIR